MSVRLEVITAAPGAAPDAVLLPAAAPVGYRIRLLGWASLLVDGSAWGPSRRDPLLEARWGCEVVCSGQFSAWWRARAGRPSGFFLEVL